MPSWPNRLLPPRPPPGASASNPPSSTSPSPSPSPGHSRMPSRITESDILENAYGIPTLPPSPRAALKTRGRGGGRRGIPSRSGDQSGSQSHTRAVSLGHTLPGLFARGRKGGAGANRSGDGEDSGPMPHQREREQELSSLGLEAGLKKYGLNSKVKGAEGDTGNPSKEMVTGKCMTCDSLVRWPRELSVFRCTVCLTINDLHPVSLEVQRENGVRVKTGKEGGKGGAGVPQLSIGRTRELIEKCVVDYLLQRLTHQDGDVKGKRDAVGRKNTQETGRDELSLSTKVHSVLPLTMTAIGLNEAEHHRGRENSHRQDSIENSEDQIHAAMSKETHARQGRVETPQSIFQPLEDFIILSFGTLECINNSFKTSRPSTTLKIARADKGKRKSPFPGEKQVQSGETLWELDAKTLHIGDITESSSWWRGDGMTDSSSPERSRAIHGRETSNDILVTLKSPMIDWADVNEWYYLVLNAGRSWQQKLNEIVALEPHMGRPPLSDKEMDEIEAQMIEAQFRAQRVLLKATESLLKRPGRLLQEPGDLRFLLIILANPLLYPNHSNSRPTRSRSASTERKIIQELSTRTPKDKAVSPNPTQAPNTGRGSSGRHSGIIKRILGLLSNLPNECHHHLVSWFARYSDGQFQRTTDLIGSFVTYRLTRQNGAKREVDQDPTAGLVPSMSSSGRNTSAALHAAIGSSGQSKKNDSMPQAVIYNDDWQIKAAARVMALFFSASNSGLSRKVNAKALTPENGQSAGLAARERAYNHGQILPTSDFYNTLLDYSDLIADFEAWESKRGKFTFCQYPFFLSIWAKIQIMEHDARRQMEVKAREAFFDSIMTHKNVNQYLVLKIRRDCLVEDSLKGVSEVVGSGNEEIKKGLRIEFNGEEGIDAGGLRKEWFLLLVRDVFNPEHGMFTYDEDSYFCYFNPYSFETTDQFFLVGVVLGLAIYNSTILDVALPPFAFRKLLAAGPASAPGASSHAKPIMTYTLEDLAEYRPALATGLRQLLEFDGDVESTFCRDFVADIERYGQTMQVPLCPDGEKIPVTNTNRREFVDLYVRYLLEVQVVRQFEPFKRGFFTVCGGNALSLFRPEEIELLIRGSDEPLDIASLRAVAVCENWGVPNAADSEPVVQWFWKSFETASPKDQRKLLSFITGSDRIPAMGATNLVIKLSCLGDDCNRFPVARTCFNMLSLYRYASRGKLERMLWRAVNESEGFGLK